LGVGIVREVQELLIRYAQNQEQHVRDVSIGDRGLEVAQSGRLGLLDRLNEASAVLGVMVPPAQGVHPFAAYVELCRVVGVLSIFTKRKALEPIPVYDHDNLGEIFRKIADRIRRILEEIDFEPYLQKDFVWEGNVMLAQLSPSWFDEGTEWLIGVHRGHESSPEECRRLLSPDNDFLWKFGSLRHDVRDIRGHGLAIKPEENPSRLLPPHQYWSYWRVPTELSDPNYRAVFDTQEIACYVRDHKNDKFQSSNYAGMNSFPVSDKETPTRTIEFRIAIFGLRPQG
jgi:type VI secretion system protein ImpJ